MKVFLVILIYEVINDLTSDGQVSINNTVHFQAGNTFTLKEDFCTENNVEFTAGIIPSDN